MPSSPSPFLFLVAILAVVSISIPNAVEGWSEDEILIDSPLLTSKIGTNRTVIVDLSGKEQFTSVQAAVDSIPEGNAEWIIVHVRKGVYREKITIPKNKPYIFLRGNGKAKTSIIWDDSSTDNAESATLTVFAPRVVVWGISFKNEAPLGDAGATNNRSVAAYVSADMVAFYHCRFFSKQNTLFDAKGKHYYENCYITGSIDFIFGRGRSIFKSCEIFVVADDRTTIRGSITAHNRQREDDNSGFIFIKGKVYGVGGVYLGRARAAYSRVIFTKTYFSKTIVPEGWTNWSYNESTDNLSLWEHDCYGPGSNTDHRVPWSKQRTAEQVHHFATIDFIDGKEWLPIY
ncbi:probable pectinesterase 67 [Magnolia sinica]|uniref:probable pectinesterase 67 n=1 Tax=Magnolia sinica TaxID=86752 RepID=UPI002657E23C|nr:probable pectinesterase 67 [Magnolia sinica]